MGWNSFYRWIMKSPKCITFFLLTVLIWIWRYMKYALSNCAYLVAMVGGICGWNESWGWGKSGTWCVNTNIIPLSNHTEKEAACLLRMLRLCHVLESPWIKTNLNKNQEKPRFSTLLVDHTLNVIILPTFCSEQGLSALGMSHGIRKWTMSSRFFYIELEEKRSKIPILKVSIWF